MAKYKQYEYTLIRSTDSQYCIDCIHSIPIMGIGEKAEEEIGSSSCLCKKNTYPQTSPCNTQKVIEGYETIKDEEYYYNGQAKVKLSSSLTILYPFTERISAKNQNEAENKLYTFLLDKIRKIHPSLIDIHIDIVGKSLPTDNYKEDNK